MVIKKRELFSSRSATILTMVGVAIGLGNLWRFPYMMGSHGGSAFLFVYLFFVLAFGVPAIMAEWALGRASRSGPIGAFTAAFGKPFGPIIGTLLTTTVLIANSYYLVVVAMVAYSAWFSATAGFDAESSVAYSSNHLGNGWLIGSLAIVLLAVALGVIAVGLRRGIERVSQWFVPFFGVVVVYLIFQAFALPGAAVKFAEFLRPDFSALTAVNVFAALGQAIFSLSLGGTFFVIYGSYLRDHEKIPVSALATALGDVGAAVMAALFLVPAMLVFEIDLAHGPGLIFETLPRLFMELPAGRLIGTIFLGAFAMMAFLSSLAALQVGVGGIRDFFGLKTQTVIIAVGLFEVALIVLTAFRQDLIGTMDLVFGSAMQCLGCLLACLALAWGLGGTVARQQIFAHHDSRQAGIFLFWIRWIVPLGILIVLVVATDIGQKVVGLTLTQGRLTNAMSNKKPQDLSALNQDFKKYDQVRKDQTYRLAAADEGEEFDEEYQIQVCDFSDFTSGDPQRRDQFAQDLGTAMEDIGFSILTNHGIDPQLFQKSYEKMTEFFERATSLEQRMKYVAQRQGSVKQGYFPIKQTSDIHPDLVEGWVFCRRAFDWCDDREFREQDFWPVTGFEPFFRQVCIEYQKLVLPIMQSILQYLGCDPHLYDEKLTDSNFGLRFNYYPAITAQDDESGAGRILGHEDVDLFTILPAPEVEGLQALHRVTNKWIRLRPPADSIILNTGDYMQRITNDRLPSTTHRVAKPRDRSLFGKPRLSLPMAIYVWENEILEVLPDCGPPKYEPISAIKFHTHCTSKFYGDQYAVDQPGD